MVISKSCSIFLTPLLGNLGNHAFYFNKTWHARLANNLKENRTLLMSFFPQGAEYSNYEFNGVKSDKKFNEITRLTSTEEGVVRVAESCYRVTPLNEMDKPFAMKIEEFNPITIDKIDLYLQVIVLEIIFRPIRFIFRFLKSY